MTATAGEIWLADRGDEERRLVFVISDVRFHRLAERAVVAPVLARPPVPAWPWHVAVGDHTVAVNQLGTIRTDRLLDLVDRSELDELRRVRHAVREITNAI